MSGRALAFPVSKWDKQELEKRPARQVVIEYFETESTALFRYAAFLGIDSETARDVVQDAFLKLHEHLAAEGDRTNLRAWLYRVTHNLVRGAQARASVRSSVSLERGRDASDVAKGPEDELLQRERDARLRLAVSQLSAAEQDCLALRAQGFKYREMAEVTGLATSTVAETVQRALTKLRALL